MNQDLQDRIQLLHAEWVKLQPLKEQDDKRLWLKLRLEWNYNSNHIEGNTLTYGETELLVIHGQTTGDHTLREYEEMKAHDVAIAHIRDVAGQPRDLSEVDIRNLNKLILKEPFWKEAITPDGQPSRKQIVPGEYKSSPNNVRTATGEIFEFAPPMDVPARMADLVRFLRTGAAAEAIDLMRFAAKLHHDFLLIHPFDDGNGRVARLLINYALLRKHYPPIIIKSDDKKNYLMALRKADVGDVSGLEDYFAQNLVWSLELGIKAAKGEDIEELSDVEKEIALLVHDQTSKKAPVRIKNVEDVKRLAETSWKPLLRKLADKTKEIGNLFLSRHFKVVSGMSGRDTAWEEGLDYFLSLQTIPNDIQFILQLQGYTGTAREPFDVNVQLVLALNKYGYELLFNNTLKLKKLYSSPLVSEEADPIIQDFLKSLLGQIRQASGIKT